NRKLLINIWLSKNKEGLHRPGNGKEIAVETVTTIAIEPNHIDELGHVNNTFYVAYLEQARGDWYDRAGISFSQMNERGIGTVLVRLDIQFKKELLLEDRPAVHTIPHRLGNKSF